MALNALFTGATGLQANSTALDVVGNNLANLNTTGFKTQRALFKDLVSQTLSAGSAVNGNVGGTNPTQLGFGVAVGSVTSLFEQGSITPTGRTLDMAIQGNGFFVLNSGETNVFSRAGSFDVDSAGFLVDPNTGYRVQRTGTIGEGSPILPGFQVPGDPSIRIPFGAGAQGVPSTVVTFQGNLSSGTATGANFTTSIQVFDSQSTARTLTVTFNKTAANTYTASTTINGGTATVGTTPIEFDANGLLTGPATLDVAVTGIAGAADQTITLNLGNPGQAVGLTQFGGASTAAAVTQNGSGSGTLTTVSIDQNGTLQGQFTNGRTLALAQLGIAGFNNESGLLRQGSNNFVASSASGQALIGTAGDGGRGTIQGAALEGSNVDIATEFSRLIIAQRGFQVNAQTITAANETLQQLANIIR